MATVFEDFMDFMTFIALAVDGFFIGEAEDACFMGVVGQDFGDAADDACFLGVFSGEKNCARPRRSGTFSGVDKTSRFDLRGWGDIELIEKSVEYLNAKPTGPFEQKNAWMNHMS